MAFVLGQWGRPSNGHCECGLRAIADDRCERCCFSGCLDGRWGSSALTVAAYRKVCFKNRTDFFSIDFAAGNKPNGPPVDVLTGFLAPDSSAFGRPVGVVVDKRAAVYDIGRFGTVDIDVDVESVSVLVASPTTR